MDWLNKLLIDYYFDSFDQIYNIFHNFEILIDLVERFDLDDCLVALLT